MIARSNVTSDAREIDRDLIIKLESVEKRIRHVRSFVSWERERKREKKKERIRLGGGERGTEGRDLGWEEDKTEGSEGTEFLIKFLFRSSYPARSTEPDKAVRVKRSYRK